MSLSVVPFISWSCSLSASTKEIMWELTPHWGYFLLDESDRCKLALWGLFHHHARVAYIALPTLKQGLSWRGLRALTFVEALHSHLEVALWVAHLVWILLLYIERYKLSVFWKVRECYSISQVDKLVALVAWYSVLWRLEELLCRSSHNLLIRLSETHLWRLFTLITCVAHYSLFENAFINLL
jgi:hypothetical protein